MEMKVLQLKLIDSARFMATSLSNLADNLTEGIHKIKCKDCNCLLQYESAKENSIKCKCLSCNKNYTNKIDEELKRDSWMNGKSLMKHCCLKKKNFIAT